MDYFLELLVGGLTRGSIHALIARGYVMENGRITLEGSARDLLVNGLKPFPT
jgi:ABC-type branched-subunit amino acid transport system ATPase component